MITAILVDQREPHSVQEQNYGAPTAVTMLEAGDLWATCDSGELLVVERKSPGDLLSSIADGRLVDQITRCRSYSPWVYLVVTGHLTQSLDNHVVADGRTTSWRWRDLQGALLSIQEAGAAIVTCAAEADFASTIQWLGRRDRDPGKPVETKLARRGLTIGEQILTALPGIGLQRAQTLLEEFAGNPAWALAWLTQQHALGDVAGIGEGTRRNVRRALSLTDDMELTLAPPVERPSKAEAAPS